MSAQMCTDVDLRWLRATCTTFIMWVQAYNSERKGYMVTGRKGHLRRKTVHKDMCVLWLGRALQGLAKTNLQTLEPTFYSIGLPPCFLHCMETWKSDVKVSLWLVPWGVFVHCTRCAMIFHCCSFF